MSYKSRGSVFLIIQSHARSRSKIIWVYTTFYFQCIVLVSKRQINYGNVIKRNLNSKANVLMSNDN